MQMLASCRLFAAVLACLLSACDPTAPGAGSFSGTVPRVLDRNGEEIVDRGRILVELETMDMATTTDEDGDWMIEGVPAGTYTVRISKRGFSYWREIGVAYDGLSGRYGERGGATPVIAELPDFHVADLTPRFAPDPTGEKTHLLVLDGALSSSAGTAPRHVLMSIARDSASALAMRHGRAAAMVASGTSVFTTTHWSELLDGHGDTLIVAAWGVVPGVSGLDRYAATEPPLVTSVSSQPKVVRVVVP